jgi:two-component system, NtrC family, sensor kinase
VRGFLALARGDASAGAESVEVGKLVDGAMELVEHRFTKARVNLVTDVPRELPALRGDRRLLEHALTNLLLNACDACAPGGTVEITAHEGTRDDGQRALTLEVLDDGAGISPQHAAHVTEPFFTTKEAGQGTGLGLAITSEIVRAHRGQLSLAPRAPRGTRAALTFPLATPRGEA